MKHGRQNIFLGIILLVMALLPAAVPAAPDRETVTKSIGMLQIPFIANDGQAPAHVAFYAQTFGGTVSVTRSGDIAYVLPSLRDEAVVLRERVVGGDIAEVTAIEKSPTSVSYFRGIDKDSWKRDIDTYGVVSLGEVFKGTALRLKAYGRNVEKLFHVHPGADPSSIRMAVDGAEALTLDEQGALVVKTGAGDVLFTKPVAYQQIGGKRNDIEVAYTITDNTYGFRVGAYDTAHELVIDPLLQSTYLGGGPDYIMTIAVHPGNGDVYVAGDTQSPAFPGTATGAFINYNAGNTDVFVAWLSPNLLTLNRATYLGGTLYDDNRALAIGFDATNGVYAVYVGGMTQSADFPVTTGPAFAGTGCGYVAKFSIDLTTFLAARYLSDSDVAALAIGGGAPATLYAAGSTVGNTTLLPATAGGAQPAFGGIADGYVAAIDQATLNIMQATFIGGTGGEIATALAVNTLSGNVYVGGYTRSCDLPNTAGGAQPTNSCTPPIRPNGFITKFASTLTGAFQSTYLGPSGYFNHIFALALDPSTGEVYAGGDTDSPTFTNATCGGQTTISGTLDGFVSRLDPNLTSTAFVSTYLGGSGSGDAVNGLVFANNRVYAVGPTNSTDFPGTSFGWQPTFGGGSTDAFVAAIDPSLASYNLTATYLGGTGSDSAHAIAAFGSTIYVVGDTLSANFPLTAGGAQSTLAGSENGFISMFDGTLYSWGSISGSVTSTVPGGPIAGVGVFAYSTTTGAYGSATTDTGGIYIINGLPAGSYVVQFDAWGMNYLQQYYNNAPDYLSATPVTVTAGATTPNINAALVPGGQITGNVTPAGSFISVAAYGVGSPYPTSATMTSGGIYTISGLPTGNYQVLFNNGCSNNTMNSAWYPNAPDRAGAASVAVTAGSVTSNINGALIAAGAIDGFVSSDGINGLPSIPIDVVDALTGAVVNSTVTSSAGTVCTGGGTPGHYSFGCLTPGNYKVVFHGAPSYPDQWYHFMSSFATATTISIAGGTTATGIDAIFPLPASPPTPAPPGGIVTHTIRAFSESGGTMSPSGIVLVDDGADQNFTITPLPGYAISDVLVDGLSVGPVGSYTFKGVTTDHEISPRFVRVFTIKASAASGGTISPAGDVVVKKGWDQTFTIAPLSGYKITNVFVDGVNQGAITTYTFRSVLTDHVITATFESNGTPGPGPGPGPGPSDFSITATTGQGGTITPEGTTTVKPGADLTLVIAADPGYRVASVKVDGRVIGAVTTLTLYDIKSSHTIEVVFARK